MNPTTVIKEENEEEEGLDDDDSMHQIRGKEKMNNEKNRNNKTRRGIQGTNTKRREIRGTLLSSLT